MIRKLDHTKMGKSDLGWLQSIFHFSFAEYYNPENMNFGKLRVINDDLVKSQTGFEMHPHRDMEIISYVVDGELTHGDSMKNKQMISRGHVQYMSAGTGILHSEHNYGSDTARFLQIWILPDQKGYKPNYGDFRFEWSERVNQWFHIVSGHKGSAPIKINQDANIFVLELDADKQIDFEVKSGRQTYVVLIEGDADINNNHLITRDGLESVEESLKINAAKKTHMLVIEMKKED